MCTEDDILWIENFHQRILNQTDPITQYDKALMAQRQDVKPTRIEKHSKTPYTVNRRTQNNRRNVYSFFITIVMLLLAMCFYFIFVKMIMH